MSTWKLFPVSDFKRYREIWDDLNARGPSSPVMESRFYAHLLEQFANGEEILALAGTTEGYQAAAVVERKSFYSWSSFQPSQAPLGAWLQLKAQSVDALARGLLHRLPGFPLVLGVTQQDPDIVPRASHRPFVSTLDYISTARIPITETFEAYWAKRGKNLRHNLRRQTNKLNKSGITTRLEILTSPDDMRSGVESFSKLEVSGWKAGGGTAVTLDGPQGRFYSLMLEDFAKTGNAFVMRYWYNDRIVAVNLCIDGFGMFIVLKTTYDESERTTSPAALMRLEYFQRLFQEKSGERIEFYGKIMDWHTKWSDESRSLYHLNAFRWRFLPSIAGRLQRPSASTRTPGTKANPNESPESQSMSS